MIPPRVHWLDGEQNINSISLEARGRTNMPHLIPHYRVTMGRAHILHLGRQPLWGGTTERQISKIIIFQIRIL